MPLAADVDLRALAALTENYSGADMATVAKYAAYAPMRAKNAALKRLFPKPEQIGDFIQALKAGEAEVKAQPITQLDLVDAINACPLSNSQDGLRRYHEYDRDHGAR